MKARTPVDGSVQCGRNVPLGAVDALYILEQTDGLRDNLRVRVTNFLRNSVDLATDFAGNVARNQVIDLVDLRQNPDRLLSQFDPRMNQ